MTNGFLQIDCVCVCQDKACPNQSTVKIWHVSSLFYIPNESSPTGYLFKRCAWMCNSLSTIESGHCINRNFFCVPLSYPLLGVSWNYDNNSLHLHMYRWTLVAFVEAVPKSVSKCMRFVILSGCYCYTNLRNQFIFVLHFWQMGFCLSQQKDYIKYFELFYCLYLRCDLSIFLLFEYFFPRFGYANECMQNMHRIISYAQNGTKFMAIFHFFFLFC